MTCGWFVVISRVGRVVFKAPKAVNSERGTRFMPTSIQRPARGPKLTNMSQTDVHAA